jgi:uncharacterized protein
MIEGCCPTCSKPYTIGALEDLPSFPFCCERCRLIDLGRWADGRYAIPDEAAREAEDQAEDAAAPTEDGGGSALPDDER